METTEAWILSACLTCLESQVQNKPIYSNKAYMMLVLMKIIKENETTYGYQLSLKCGTGGQTSLRI